MCSGNYRTAAANNDRFLGRRDGVNSGGHCSRIWPHARFGRKCAMSFLGPDFIWIDGRFLSVERQGKMNRAGRAGGHGSKRPAHHRRQPFGLIQRGIPLCQRTEKRLLIQFGQWVFAARRCRHIRGDRQDGNRAFIGFNNARQNIGRATTGGAFTDAGFAGHPGVSVRHISRMPLVAGQNMRHAVVEPRQTVIEG